MKKVLITAMAAISIGPGAKCIDPVWHLFYGRTIPKGRYGAEYAVFLQYPEGQEERVADIIPMKLYCNYALVLTQYPHLRHRGCQGPV